MYDLESETFFVSRDVVFHEHVFPFASTKNTVFPPVLSLPAPILDDRDFMVMTLGAKEGKNSPRNGTEIIHDRGSSDLNSRDRNAVPIMANEPSQIETHSPAQVPTVDNVT